MIRLLLIAILLGAAVWAGVHLHLGLGSLIIITMGKSYEMSLWLALILIILLFTAFYLVYQFFKMCFNFLRWLTGLREQRGLKLSKEETQVGMLALAEGRWKDAEKALNRGSRYSDQPLLNYLGAAWAAKKQNESEKSQRYFAMARTVCENADLAIGLTQAQLQLSCGDFEESLLTVKTLQKLDPKQPLVLTLLMDLNLHLRDWESLVALMPQLKKHDLVSQEVFVQTEHVIYQHLLKEKYQGVSALILKRFWVTVPKWLQSDPELVSEYAEKMLRRHEDEEAALVLKQAINSHWSEHLVLLYGRCQSDDLIESLETAEHWLKKHPESANLLLTCGRLAAQNNELEKAESYLGSCISSEPMSEAYAVLGLLYERMKKHALSAECFRKGLLLATSLKSPQTVLLTPQEETDAQHHVD